MTKKDFQRLLKDFSKEPISGPLYRLAKCYICTITMLNSNQSITPLFLERVSNRSGRNRVFLTLCVVPIPLLSAEVTTAREREIIEELKQMLLEADFRIVASVADVMIGAFGGSYRNGYGIIGNPVDNLLKATLSLPNTSSWITRDLADALGSPRDAEQLVGETSFFRVG
jgi:hypothetical protein